MADFELNVDGNKINIKKLDTNEYEFTMEHDYLTYFGKSFLKELAFPKFQEYLQFYEEKEEIKFKKINNDFMLELPIPFQDKYEIVQLTCLELTNLELAYDKLQELYKIMYGLKDDNSKMKQLIDKYKNDNIKLKRLIEKYENNNIKMKRLIDKYENNNINSTVDMKTNTYEKTVKIKKFYCYRTSISNNLHNSLYYLTYKDQDQVYIRCYNKYEITESQYIEYDKSRKVKWYNGYCDILLLSYVKPYWCNNKPICLHPHPMPEIIIDNVEIETKILIS